MRKVKKAVNAPKGFVSNGYHSGIKKRRKDVSLIYSETPCNVAGVFTRNIVKAAPLVLTKEIVEKGGKVHAVIVNSGNANACTGEEGFKDACSMAQKVQEVLKIPENSVLVGSTGVIGVKMPMQNILEGIEEVSKELRDSQEAAAACAEGILTTDTFIKGVAYEFELGGKLVKIGAIAKGSGMIHPNMGTMLGFITTDCNISTQMLQSALSESTDTTYNMVSVDGDTSTNDMVLILANGLAKNPEITEKNQDYETFKSALNAINKNLAKQIILDGEGATKFIESNVKGAKSLEDARCLAKTIITSSLVKTAFFGEDANWGRILAAMGRSGISFNPCNVKIELCSCENEDMQVNNSIAVMENGTPTSFDEEAAHELLKKKFIKINIELQDGKASAAAWGCDLSYEYVRINGEYRT